MQIEELQAQESQLRAAESEGQGHGPISALLLQLGHSTPEETQDALQELLGAAAAARSALDHLNLLQDDCVCLSAAVGTPIIMSAIDIDCTLWDCMPPFLLKRKIQSELCNGS